MVSGLYLSSWLWTYGLFDLVVEGSWVSGAFSMVVSVFILLGIFKVVWV